MKKIFFFGDKKIVVFSNKIRLQNFCVGEIFSSEKFPRREYFKEKIKEGKWELMAFHANEDQFQEIAAFVWAAKSI